MKTELEDRVLWFDGTNEVKAELVPSLLLAGVNPAKIVVSELSDDIVRFNHCSDEVIPTLKTDNAPLQKAWLIPDTYKKLNLSEYFLQRIAALNLGDEYIERILIELDEIEARCVADLMRTLIYVVDVFEDTGVIWGVGRGSSCASLALFLMGLHKVDPVLWEIPHTEFFHD